MEFKPGLEKSSRQYLYAEKGYKSVWETIPPSGPVVTGLGFVVDDIVVVVAEDLDDRFRIG
jgi:hypothetical protein